MVRFVKASSDRMGRDMNWHCEGMNRSGRLVLFWLGKGKAGAEHVAPDGERRFGLTRHGGAGVVSRGPEQKGHDMFRPTHVRQGRQRQAWHVRLWPDGLGYGQLAARRGETGKSSHGYRQGRTRRGWACCHKTRQRLCHLFARWQKLAPANIYFLKE